MRLFYRIAADALFLFHFFLVSFGLFGWTVPALWPLYMTLLAATLMLDLTLGYCLLSKWEFDLRRKIDPTIEYDFSWTTYYTYKLTHRRVSNEFFVRATFVFIVGSLVINLYFYLV